jgi:hypothetical protein
MKTARKKAARTFKEFINDDENFNTLLRCAERLGLLESFLGDDGQIHYRSTDKEITDEAIEQAAAQAAAALGDDFDS